MKKIQITIQDKKPYSGNASRHPEGDFYFNGEKYTCWDNSFFETFNVGDSVLIEYTEKINGEYVNKNISKMSFPPSTAEAMNDARVDNNIQYGKTGVNANTNASVEKDIVVGSVNIGNSRYEVILRLING